MKQKSLFLMVDGHEVRLSFQSERNTNIIGPLKQALISSYVNGKQNDDCTFDTSGETDYDGKGGNSNAP